MPHSIRLRHPWQREDSATMTCFRRRFNWPLAANAEDDKADGRRVELVIDGAASDGVVYLNEVRLGPTGQAPLGGVAGSMRYLVHALLTVHNELRLEYARLLTDEAIDKNDDDSQAFLTAVGEIRLEIHEEEND